MASTSGATRWWSSPIRDSLAFRPEPAGPQGPAGGSSPRTDRSSTWATSRTWTPSPEPSAWRRLMASASITMQYGQAVPTTSAPVARASSVRSRLTRLPMRSSIHMRAPPAPQQKPRSRQRCISTEVGVLAGQGVEAVGAGGDHLAGADAVQGLDVLLGLELVEVLVAEPPGRVAGAGLARAEHGEADPGPVQQPGDRPGRLARPVLQGGRAADPVEVLDVVGDPVADHRDLEVEALGPGQALAGAQAPGVAGVLDVAQHVPGLGREARLHQDLVAAQLHDGVDVLDVDRALLDAGPAGGARPEHVGPDHLLDQVAVEHGRVVAAGVVPVGLAEQERGLLEQVVAQVGDDQLGRERLAGVPGRALVLAAAALGAGGQVEQLLEVEVLDLAGDEDVLLGHLLGIDPGGGHRAHGLGAAGEGDVERGGEDVQVLGVDDQDQEAEDDREVGEQEALVEQP